MSLSSSGPSQPGNCLASPAGFRRLYADLRSHLQLVARLSASGGFRRKEHVRPIKTLMRADRKARVLILLRDDGFYMFQAEYYLEDEGYTCWLGTSTIPSGIFDSAVKAEREAIRCVPWLRRQPE
jgi:hypothetical protein